jgi:hypothetical protein
LWRDLTHAIVAKDMDAATEAKGAVENAQRELRATGVQHTTRFFELRDNRWIPRIHQYVKTIFEPVFLVIQTIHKCSRKTHKRQPRQYRHGYGPVRPKAVTHRALEQSTPQAKRPNPRIAVVAILICCIFALLTAESNFLCTILTYNAIQSLRIFFSFIPAFLASRGVLCLRGLGIY